MIIIPFHTTLTSDKNWPPYWYRVRYGRYDLCLRLDSNSVLKHLMKNCSLQMIDYHGKFRLDDGFGELCRNDIGVLGFDFPDAWKGEAFHSTPERTEIWRKQERQHVDSPVRQIHSCAPEKRKRRHFNLPSLEPFHIWINWSLLN